MSSRSKSRQAHSAAAISGANWVEQYAVRWSSMLMNIGFQREGGLTDIGRFRGGREPAVGLRIFAPALALAVARPSEKAQDSGGMSRNCSIEEERHIYGAVPRRAAAANTIVI